MEIRFHKESSDSFRLRLTYGKRKTLAEIGKKLGRNARDEVANLVKPETILAWHRQLFPASPRECQVAKCASLRESLRLFVPPFLFFSF